MGTAVPEAEEAGLQELTSGQRQQRRRLWPGPLLLWDTGTRLHPCAITARNAHPVPTEEASGPKPRDGRRLLAASPQLAPPGRPRTRAGLQEARETRPCV